MTTDPRLRAEINAHPYPLLFATVSGAHLYGFPSADSDHDLRGVHLLPLEHLVGLSTGEETVSLEHVRDGAEVDLVTHEACKFLRLLLRNNGYVLEQLYSPLVVHTTPGHAELKRVARGCITRGCVRHYAGFAAGQWRLWDGEHPRRLKPLLYLYRVLLTGITLMRTGRVNASLPSCNYEMGLPYIDDLIARKVNGDEQGIIRDADVEFHRAEYLRLHALLVESAERSTLPDTPGESTRRALHDLLVQLRMQPLAAAA
ncbi:MAG TPA: nucleotidyltransferase domain-containing protein [Longimicrobium sp.]|uniref:nucleotidyltransferase domain-containing protein n=1 Tax=Longimicrobium sp. TaxID=2029185 RepID=UPI002ED9709D